MYDMATKKTPGKPERSGGARRKPTGAEAAERVVKKIDDKLARTAEKLDRKSAQIDRRAVQMERASAKIQDHQEMLERLSHHLGALDIWTRAEPGSRRPRFTRDDIAAAAVNIADTEGFAAVSMRHLAGVLGAGTMTLYHYVRTKDELLTLVNDAVMGEVVVPPDETLPADWRAATTVIAHRTRTAMLRHPWILDITDDPPIGPNSVRHFEQSLQAVAALDISLEHKLDIVGTVDEYVFGHCLIERNNGPGETVASDAMMSFVNNLVTSGEFPQLRILADAHGFDEGWALIDKHFRDPDRFERNLTRILDGIEAGLAR
jgi:AcrR family transcriptional regulator